MDKNTHINLRIPLATRQQLEKLAKLEERTLSDTCRLILKHEVTARLGRIQPAGRPGPGREFIGVAGDGR
jgi:hypothetical protein